MNVSQGSQGDADVHAALHVVARWAHALDGRDWVAAEASVAERVYMDYSALNGSAAGERIRAELVASWRNGVGKVASSQHLIGLADVATQDDAVRVTANAQVSMASSAGAGGVRWSVGCRYEFTIVDEGGAWKIAGIVLTVLWQEGDRAAAMAPTS